MKKEASKQAMDAARKYIGERIALALWVSPQEKEGLRAMGYDPDKLICIERFNDEIRTVKSNGKIDYTCTVYEAEKNASFHRYVCIYSDWKRRIKGGAAYD